MFNRRADEGVEIFFQGEIAGRNVVTRPVFIGDYAGLEP